MKSDVLSLFPHLRLSVVGMLIFAAVFIGWCVWAFSRRRKPHFDQLSKLPLED